MTSVKQSEFAKLIGRSSAYVTKLKQAGRLVFDGAGLVDVEKSKELMEETKDPSKQAVADRHEQERQHPSVMDDMSAKVGSAYQQARAMKEKYNAMQAKMSYEKDAGELLEVQKVISAVMDGDAIVRNRLESLPDLLAPQLAIETDEQKIRAIILDQIEFMLNDISQTFKKLSHD